MNKLTNPAANMTISEPMEAIDLFQQACAWNDILGEAASSVELEIGSGKGLFLQHAAAQHPETTYVGIELAAKFANRACKRIAKLGLTNVRMLRGDAKRFLHEVVPPSSLTRIHVYFPDPWWRNRHKKRRVLNEQTLQDLERALNASGEFHFWTDVADYYEHICDQVMQLTELSGPRYVAEKVAMHSMDYTTHFERRARLNSQPVYRAVFVKSA